MRIVKCDQGTPEWLRARLGVATASRAEDALSVLKSGAPAKASIDYAVELAFERVAGTHIEKAVTVAMQRGSELEPFARAAYEARTGILVDELGFALHDTLPCGASPDGLVGDDGLIEIKCPFDQSRIARMWATGDVSDYLAQVDWQLWILGRAWCDVVVYDPRLERSGMEMLVVRHQRDDARIKRIEDNVPGFLALVDDIEAKMHERRAGQ